MVAKSILIVEDDITYGMMLKTWLGKKGFRVASASSIQRAKAHLEAEGADLILSDLRLPDRDGTYLLEWLRGRGLSIPLIIMTGYADIQSAVKAMKMGACDYVAKPVNPDELLKKIAEALNAPAGESLCKTLPPARGEKGDGLSKESAPAYSPFETDFLEGESVHQHALNFIIFHGIFNHQLINQRNILEQSCAGINKQKASLINQTRLDLQAGLPDRRLTPYTA